MGKLRSLMVFERGQRITEHQLMQMVALSVCGIVLCMACLAATTWAWFTVSLHSTENQIRVGQFSVSVAVATGEEALEQENGVYTLAPGEYTVTLNNTGDTNACCTLTLSQDGSEIIRLIPLKLADDAFRQEPDQEQISIEIPVTVHGQEATLTVRTLWGVSPDSTLPVESMIIGEPQAQLPEEEPVEEPAEEPTEDPEGEPVGEPTQAPEEEPTELPAEDDGEGSESEFPESQEGDTSNMV